MLQLDQTLHSLFHVLVGLSLLVPCEPHHFIKSSRNPALLWMIKSLSEPHPRSIVFAFYYDLLCKELLLIEFHYSLQ